MDPLYDIDAPNCLSDREMSHYNCLSEDNSADEEQFCPQNNFLEVQ
jgi:hypothetical protein